MVTVAGWAAEKAARDVEDQFVGERQERHRRLNGGVWARGTAGVDSPDVLVVYRVGDDEAKEKALVATPH